MTNSQNNRRLKPLNRGFPTALWCFAHEGPQWFSTGLYSNFTTVVAMELTATQVGRWPRAKTIAEPLGDQPRRESGLPGRKWNLINWKRRGIAARHAALAWATTPTRHGLVFFQQWLNVTAAFRRTLFSFVRGKLNIRVGDIVEHFY